MLASCDVVLAYIDPGTGAIALQILMGLILGAGVFFRRVFLNPMSLFRRRGDANAAPAHNEDNIRKAA